VAITGPAARRCRVRRRVITTVSRVLAVSHATSGAALGLAVAGFAPRVADVHPSPGSVLTFAAVCAGAAVLLGLAVNLASAAWGEPVLLATLFVCIALAIKGLDALVPGPPSLVIAAGLTYAVQEWVPGGTAGTAGWLGTAVALGMVVHSVGDAVTESGAPLLWPVPIRGRTWYPVGGPRVTRFRTGGAVESWLVAPALTVGTVVLAVLVIPGVLPVFLAVRDQVQRLLGA